MTDPTFVVEPPVIPAKFKRLYQQKYSRIFTLDQFDFFLSQCEALELDPRLEYVQGKLIPTDQPDEKRVVIQLGIMAYRALAHRTGCYAGLDDAVHGFDGDNRLAKSTVTAYRFVQGQRCSFTATARYDEYAPISLASYRDGMPHHWLDKCAEAAVLRKTFPEQYVNVYIQEELAKIEGLQPPNPPLKAGTGDDGWRDDVPDYQPPE